MEAREENERLTRVSRGTPMGELLRRYWWPVAGTAELVEQPTKLVKLLGESLVLYRDRQGRLGLLQSRCAHRSFDMGAFAIPEEDGLRCPYHGWLYDSSGQCLETPPEPRTSTFKDRISIDAYPVEELGGLIWAYLGPQPVPLLPRWDLLVRPNAFRQIGQTVIPCNWLQIMENSVDTVHTEWMHGHMFREVLRRKEQGPTPLVSSFLRHHEQVRFEPFEYGIRKYRLLEGQSEEAEDWTHGHPLVFPSVVRIGGANSGRYEFQIRVPMDDTHTWHLAYHCYDPGANVEVPPQDPVPMFETPITDPNGKYIFDYVLAQDMVAWWSQGSIVDRSIEKLAESDRGLIMFRRLLKQQMQIVADGGEPLNVFRDAERNEVLRLTADLEPTPAERARGCAFTWDHIREQTGECSPHSPQLEALYRASGRAVPGEAPVTA
jgi:5,5'-dehydrodivanillate O-demethylase